MSMCMCKCDNIFDSDFELGCDKDGMCICDNCYEELIEKGEINEG